MALAGVMAVSGVLLAPPASVWAATNSSVSLTTSTATSRLVGSRFDYAIGWACSAAASSSCDGLAIEVPVTLTAKPGQIEDLQRWAFSSTFPVGSQAGFTRSMQQQGTQVIIRYTASKAIPAGTQESIALSITPHAATGNNVQFTVGEARLTTSNGDPATAPGLQATVTNTAIPAPAIDVISGDLDSSGRGIVHYEILPNFDRVYDSVSGTWQSWRGINSPNTLTTVTAIDGTESIRISLPAGATIMALGAGGAFESHTNEIVWLAGTGTGNSPLQFTLSYDANLNNSVVQLTGQRAFTETNGEQNVASISLPHRLQLAENLTQPVYDKCGQGSVNGLLSERVAGQCATNYVTPVPNHSVGAGDWLQYRLSATKLEAGDQLRITDWAPCRTAPVTDGYASQANCADPLAWFSSFALEARTGPSGSTSTIVVLDSSGAPVRTIGGGATGASQPQSVSFSEVELFRSDGQTTRLSSTTMASLPALPAGVRYVGFTALTAPLAFPGQITVIPTLQISPSIDRAMTLQNSADWNLIRRGIESAPKTSTGAAAIVNSVAGRVETSFTTGANRPLRGSFQAFSLDPALGLPVYMLELPEGYSTQQDNLSSVRFFHEGTQVSSALYDVTLIPEDRSTGARAMIRAVPKPGSAAVPNGAGSGWPLLQIYVNIEPRTAAQFGPVEAQNWISVQGSGVQLDRCNRQTGTVFLTGDAADRDGDGVTTADTFCRSSIAKGNYPSTNAAAASVAVKEVRDAESNTWSGANAPVSTASGRAEYRLHWENAGSEPLSDVVLYDILPHPGDTGTISATANTNRGSAFSPVFEGLTSAVPAGTTLEYSASSNPCRPEVHNSASCVNDWSSDLSAVGAENVRALKITLPGTRPTGSGYNLYYEMSVPTATASGVSAWNTLASRANHNGQPLDAAETARVGIMMPAQVTVAKDSPSANQSVVVGDQVTYTLTATNNLTSVANGITLTDDLSDVLQVAEYSNDAVATTGTVEYQQAQKQLQWNGSLQPGETLTITYSVTVTDATESLVNRVTGVIGALPTNCETGAESGCFVSTRVHRPSVTIDKQAPGIQAGTSIEGNTVVQWHYVVRNDGSEPLKNLVVTDDRGVMVTCANSTLSIGASMTCYGSGSVGTSSPYSNLGQVTGVSTVTGTAVTASDRWSTELIPLTTTLSVDKFAEDFVEGSTVDAEQQITWTYRVTNTGTDRLVQLAVIDDQGVAVSCQTTQLAPGESVDCEGTGRVGLFGLYRNTGTATAVGHYTAGIASGSDSWAVEVEPYSTGVVIEKTAPSVTGNTVRPNTEVEWHYIVTNVGEEALRNVTVTDDQGVSVSCPGNELPAGESMLCTGTASVGSVEGQYTNIGEVRAETLLTSTPVSDDDTWTVQVRELVPSLSLVKGAVDAREGEPTPAMHLVHWQYTVTNTGEEPVFDLQLVDDQGVAVTCPVTELAIGQSVTCFGEGVVGAGSAYTNIATATATGTITDQRVAQVDDWSVPIQAAELGLRIVKDAEGIDEGNAVSVDQIVTWHYTVTNTGREPLENLSIIDDQGVEVLCEVLELGAGESTTCVGSGSVGGVGTYTNIATATATGSWTDRTLSEEDSWSADVVAAPVRVDPPMPPASAGAHGLVNTGDGSGARTAGFGLVVLLLGLLMLGLGVARRGARNSRS